MARQTARTCQPDWPTCLEPSASCRGIRTLHSVRCLAHLGPAELDAVLRALRPGDALDLRGTRLGPELLARVLGAVRDPAGTPRLGAVDLGDADLAGDADFGGVAFEGCARFDGARFEGEARFNGARFEDGARFVGAEFERAASFQGAELSGRAWFGGARFADDLRFCQASLRGDIRF